MQTIGLIGGMSWESSQLYYRIINEQVRQRLGGFHSARSLMYSVDFASIEQMQQEGRWEDAGAVLIDAAQRLKRGGADFCVLCTNTMHKLAPEIEAAVPLPLLHIADPTAEAIQRAGFKRVGLLGTRFTMEERFYRGRLTERHGIEVIIPDKPGRAVIHQVIYEELCLGVIRRPSRTAFQGVIADLERQGAEAVILGCTEINLLIRPGDSPLPLFDTTELHAIAPSITP